MPENTPTTDDQTTTDDVPDDVDVITDVSEFIENDPLLVLFGNESKVRIVGALLAAPEPLNPARIQERAGLGSPTSWYENKDDLLEAGLVEQTGNAGNSPLYALVEDDPRVEALETIGDVTRAALRD